MNEDRNLMWALAASAVIVGGGITAILAAGGGILEGKPAVSEPSRGAAMPPGTANAGDGERELPTAESRIKLPTEPARGNASAGSAIYRCQANGATTYSDTPCAGGLPVDTRPAISGYAAPVAPRQVAPQKDAVGTRSGAATQAGTAETPAHTSAQCDAIRAGIERIDAQARAGGSATHQDYLRQERAKLVDARYRLKC